MRKAVGFVIAVMLFIPLDSYALGIGGTQTQGQGKIGISVNGDYVFDRDLSAKAHPISISSMDTMSATTNIDKMDRPMAKFSYGLFNNLDIYMLAGSANLTTKSKYKIVHLDNAYELGTLTTKGSAAFAYGGGLKGEYALKYGWIIGANAQYIRHKNDFKGTDDCSDYTAGGVFDGSSSAPLSGTTVTYEWQVSPYIAKEIGNFTPYVGVSYSDMAIKGRIKSGDYVDFKYRADNNVGPFVGIDCKIGKNLKLNIEGRFVDETAVSGGIAYQF